MKSIKALLGLIPVTVLTLPILFSCNNNNPQDGTIYLKVLNSEDYIYKKENDGDKDDLIVQFEQYMAKPENGSKKVKVIYDTFDTMENMYNTLKTGKTKYDLVCASEYMVQKLAREKVNGEPIIQKLDKASIPNYYKDEYKFDNGGASPYIRNKLSLIPAIAGKEISEVGSLDDYAICYMWGTLGIIYNPQFQALKDRGLTENEIHNAMKDWGTLWDSKYKKTISIKDSMRDTYAVGIMHSFKDELRNAGDDFTKRNAIFNYGGMTDSNYKSHINTVKEDLLKLRNNIFGFEVDSGKQDIVTGKIGVDTAWSGDAVHSMNDGDKQKAATLYYSIPEDGTNLWFDCWTMQSSCQGENKIVANKFLDFISHPDNAIQNMNYIGFTSPIAGKTVFDWFNKVKYKPASGVSTSQYNVTYFFGEDGADKRFFTIDSSIINRQMAAQFPENKLNDKLMIMQDYGDNNDLILSMWEQVKHESLPVWAIVLLSIEGGLVVGGIAIFVTIKVKDKKRRKSRKNIQIA